MRVRGVSAEPLRQYGAVSAETAAEMAQGVRRAAGADFGIGITGIAGPGGGTKEKPVGLVYIGCLVKGNVSVQECRFAGMRQENRAASVEHALRMLKEELKKLQ